MNKFLKYNQRDPLPDERKISYSQFSMYSQCPKHWELAYAKGLRTFSQSIHTIFGTAMHETLQHFLTVMYDESVKKAEEIDLHKYLKDQMYNLYKEAVEKMGEHFSNKFELGEFYEDGVAIIDWFKRKRGGYFSRKNEELIGIEVPIYHPVNDTNDKVMMLGYLDIVIRDKRNNKITIIDIKYMIVKRKLIEGAMFPQKRITEFSPASGKPTRNKLTRSIEAFVENSFHADGSYNLDKEYVAVAGKNNKNCKWCEFKDQPDLCPVKNRIKEY